MKSQWAFYTRPFADLAKGLSENVFIGIWLARLFVDDNQGAADADVPAEESQAKEGAWELFTG